MIGALMAGSPVSGIRTNSDPENTVQVSLSKFGTN